jgi:exopolysaccharide biosynthesis operon protein EpsL
MHDDNLFRRPADGSLGAVVSDRVTSTQVGFAFHKPISLQVFDLSANIVDNRHQNFKALDSRNDGYSAVWRWQITPSLTGSLSSDRQQSQTDFADFRGAGQNLRTTANRRFDANWKIMGGWTIGAGATNVKASNSQPFAQDPGSEQRVADLSLKYLFASGTMLALTSRKSNGDFHRAADPVALSDSRFSERHDEIRLDWPVTGKAKVSAGYGHLARRHDTFSVRDYSGGIGSINLDWAATGKTSFGFGRVRSLENWEDPAGSYAIRDTTSLSGKWQASSKLLVSAIFDRESRSLNGFALAPPPNARVDWMNKELVSIQWSAMQNLTLTASLQKSRRRSNSPGLDYDDRLTTISASVAF